MLIKRSISPDGRIDSVSVELSMPVADISNGEIKDKVDRLKSSIAIEDLIARYVELSTSGQNYRARCPFHDDRNPSFVVYPETQTFYCFGSRAHGDVLSFLMRKERLTFPEALTVLRELNGGETDRHIYSEH
jgi:DNA primase